MQTRGRRRHRAFLRRIDCLIVLPVALVGRPARRDVRRQRRVADGAERLVEIRAVKAEGEPNAAVRLLLVDRRLERAEQADAPFMPEADAVADGEPTPRLRERPPCRLVDPFDQRNRDLRGITGALAHAMQLCRYHSGIVEHQHIPRAEKIGKLADATILETCARPYDKQPRGVARACRAERNPLLRQVEIEVGDTHGWGLSCKR